MARTYRSTPEPHFSKLSQDCIELAKTVNNIPVVTANPELAGTEANLTGLQVGSTKYAVSGGSASGFLVTFTPEKTSNLVYKYTADKTFGEIFEAFEAGQFPLVKMIADEKYILDNMSDVDSAMFMDFLVLSKVEGTDETITYYTFPNDGTLVINSEDSGLHSTDPSAYPNFTDDYNQE